MAKHIIDAKNRILGRLAVEAANLLRGKGKADFVPYLDKGEEVAIKNTDRVKVSGKKAEQKIYYRHSGYPGGLTETKFAKAMKDDSREVVRRAIYGMLPKNKLRNKVIKKLKLYKGEAEGK